jgi:hypothetical protein
MATAQDFDGDGWGVDYPRADINLTFRLSELTKTTVSRDSRDGYNHVVVRLTDPLLYHCPFIMMSEPGGAFFDAGAFRRFRRSIPGDVQDRRQNAAATAPCRTCAPSWTKRIRTSWS